MTTCLNPLHTALAVNGSLLGFNSIAKEVSDKDMLNLIKQIGYVEGLPVVTDPKVINPKTFIDQLVNKRLPNPYIPDMPQRIAADTSQKLSVRYGVTINITSMILNATLKIYISFHLFSQLGAVI